MISKLHPIERFDLWKENDEVPAAHLRYSRRGGSALVAIQLEPSRFAFHATSSEDRRFSDTALKVCGS